MCAATLAIRFDSLEVVKKVSDRKQSALTEAAQKYAESKSKPEDKKQK